MSCGQLFVPHTLVEPIVIIQHGCDYLVVLYAEEYERMQRTYRTILLERHPAGYAVLTLNRPDKLNALSVELRSEVAAAIDELRGDSAIRVLILTGAGRAFCADLDLTEWNERKSNSGGAFELDPVAALRLFEGPVIGV